MCITIASNLWTVLQVLGHLVQRTKEELTKSRMKKDFTQNQNENNKGIYQESVADSEHLVTVCDFLVWVHEKGLFVARGKAWVVSCLIDKHGFLGISSLHVLFLTMFLQPCIGIRCQIGIHSENIDYIIADMPQTSSNWISP